MTPEQLKASILQRAMEGKLVPQDPNDEPASELLKRIKAEKEKLIKEGKIKRDKNETEIFRGDDGLHYEKFPDGTIERLIFDFDIPDTWELTRLRNIGNIISGGTPKTTEKSYYNGNIPWITPSDMGKQQNRIYFGRASKFISEIGLNNSSAQMIPANSIVYSSRAPIGHINIVNTEFTTNQGCKSIYPLCIDNEFLYWLLKNRTTDIQRRSSGTTFKEISGRSFGDTIVCIPPYQEQKRITRKISIILKNINNYEKYYAELEQLKKDFPEKLRKSILQYAMQGKLVPQDATDEPIEILLEKIREEKQRLFEEGKLKKKDLQESIINQGDDNSYYEMTDLKEERENWLFLRVKDIFRTIPIKKYQIKQSEILKEGLYPVVSQSKNLVEGYTNSKDKFYQHSKPIIVFGDHTRIVKLVNFDFVVGADGVKLLEPIYINSEFGYLCLKFCCLDLRNRGYSRHYSHLQKMYIGIPNKIMQLRISEKITILDRYVNLLENKINKHI